MTSQPAEPDEPDVEPAPAERPEPDKSPPADPGPQDNPPPDTGDDTAEPEAAGSVQPAEAAAAREAEGKVIALPSTERRGALTLRPEQTSLDRNQAAALVAIGIDVAQDPGVEPHIRPFMHMCQVRGLDPFAREAYLIGRGKGDYRKWTMQVGIDGYRKMAAATGRFLRVKEVLWTGAEDDDRAWRAMDDGRGGVIMRRVWFDQWPHSRGYPGAAKVVIEHLDTDGQVTETEAVADWSMYAPFSPKYEYSGGRKQKVRAQDGSDVMVLNDMWAKGYAHMLAKCAEALAHRKAFPATMSGVYVHEEMHRADAEEQRRHTDDRRSRLAANYVATTAIESSPGTTATPEGPVSAGEVAQEVVEGMSPTSTAPADRETAAEPERASQGPSEDDRVRLLRAELDWQGEVLGHPARNLAARPMRALRKDLEAFTADDLLRLVGGLRPAVVQALRSASRGGDAEAYGTVGEGDVIDLAEIFPDGQPEPDARRNVDPEARHEYVDAGGVCEICDRFEGELPHPPKAE